ncbi:MAG: fused MFS/spermidine synthase [Bdellovibrionales bacterium]|nr:fused MFS/spermidine synthase [Bdellovibrionales bacterium]
MTDNHKRWQAARLQLTVLVCGAVVMALELAGSRVVAPFLGTSVFVWTSLIGVILAALSVGYTWGGRLADRRPEVALLGRIVLIAALLTGILSVLQYPVLVVLSSLHLDLRLGTIVASAVLFAAPAVVLGMVAPFAVRLTLNDVEHSGQLVGRLYALSTVGSIIGTFLSGFLLIAYLGTRTLILVLALLLALTSVLVAPSSDRITKFTVLLALGLLILAGSAFEQRLTASGMRDFDTSYQRALVLDMKDDSTGRIARALATDPLGSQSIMFVDNPTELAADYSKFYHLAFHFNPAAEHVLLLGGGAYSVPKDFIARYEQVTLDVVELDPGITAIARELFFLSDDPRLSIYHEDARTFLNRSTTRYDAILVDVFASSPSVPFHLTTTEAVAALHRALTQEGVLLMNVISGIEGEAGEFLRATHRTLAEHFPQVLLLPIREPNDGSQVQNLMLVALKSSAFPSLSSADEMLEQQLRHLWRTPITHDVPVLTDDFAPVEHYMLPVFLQMQRQQNSHRRFSPLEENTSS